MVIGIFGIVKIGLIYKLSVEICMTNGEDSAVTFVINPEANSFNPALPNWRTRIVNAAKTHAETNYGITIDQVLFPDFAVLGL